MIVDNAGDSVFCGLYERDISSDASWWADRGFGRIVPTTSFRSDTMKDAGQLLAWSWSNNARAAGPEVALEIEYKTAVYEMTV